MNDFYRNENIEVFRKWVYFQVKNDSRLTIEQYDSRTYKIYYKDKVARFVIWPIGVIEEAIFKDKQLLFYLHYQFQNYHMATDLFYRMIEKLTEDNNIQHKVLLCCTGGMTTGYFSEKMNKFCQLSKLPIQVDATAFYRLEENYKDYDLILIAPQLRYKVIDLRQKLKSEIIDSIDPIVFATYDCQGLMKQINGYFHT